MVVVTVQKVTLAEKKGLGRKNRSVFSHWGLRTKGGGDEIVFPIYCTDSPISLPIREKKAFLFLLHEDPFWINQRREGEIMFILSYPVSNTLPPPAKTSPPTPPETMVQNQRRGSAIVAAENCTSFDFCTSSSSSVLGSGNEEEQNHRRSVDRPHCSVCIAKANIAFRRLRFLSPPPSSVLAIFLLPPHHSLLSFLPSFMMVSFLWTHFLFDLWGRSYPSLI